MQRHVLERRDHRAPRRGGRPAPAGSGRCRRRCRRQAEHRPGGRVGRRPSSTARSTRRHRDHPGIGPEDQRFGGLGVAQRAGGDHHRGIVQRREQHHEGGRAGTPPVPGRKHDQHAQETDRDRRPAVWADRFAERQQGRDHGDRTTASRTSIVVASANGRRGSAQKKAKAPAADEGQKPHQRASNGRRVRQRGGAALKGR